MNRYWEGVSIDDLVKVSTRFAGFSLERRQEWVATNGSEWRLRILPNKQERQNYRIEVYGDTVQAVVFAALTALEIEAKGVNE